MLHYYIATNVLGITILLLSLALLFSHYIIEITMLCYYDIIITLLALPYCYYYWYFYFAIIIMLESLYCCHYHNIVIAILLALSYFNYYNYIIIILLLALLCYSQYRVQQCNYPTYYQKHGKFNLISMLLITLPRKSMELQLQISQDQIVITSKYIGVPCIIVGWVVVAVLIQIFSTIVSVHIDTTEREYF